MQRYIVISGCSGGGKSTLLEELRRLGHAVVAEPGRRIVTAEMEQGGSALPWVDAVAFAGRAIEMSLADRRAALANNGRVFFDRGLIDAVAALHHLTGASFGSLRSKHRYARRVFLVPPWPELFASDTARKHDFASAVAEYERLQVIFPALGYTVVVLPKTSVPERADLVLTQSRSP